MKHDPLRGEVWLADLGMAAKVRPVLVVSAPLDDEDFALIAVVPHTTSQHPSRYAVPLGLPGLKEGAFNVQGIIAVASSKFIRRITVATSDHMMAIDHGLKRWLQLT